MTGMCPHCGEVVDVFANLISIHYQKPGSLRDLCPGSRQIPRCAESDARPLWNGEPNTRFEG
jgi:hypothetical protein